VADILLIDALSNVEITMNENLLQRVVFGVVTIMSVGQATSQVPPSQDTIYIPGDTFHGREHAGLMEETINGDTNSTGDRVNRDRVYALYEGQYYHQLAPINVNNPTGRLTIVGVPSSYGTTKPVILITNTGNTHVSINSVSTNRVNGSLAFENIHYQAMELDGYLNAELFQCGTTFGRKQTLIVNNCLFEFCKNDLFDCTNEPGAIGGWPYGASFFITNSYFRNLFNPTSWWGSRVFQCKHAIDTMWIENCTVTTGGVTFLQKNELTDFVYVNHNTIVNNMKYWLLSPYRHYEFITNNIFTNQNWVGEDTNVTNSGQDPEKAFMSTVDLDTCDSWQVRNHGLTVQAKYLYNDSTIIDQRMEIFEMRVFISDNIDYWDPLLINGYYNSSKYVLSSIGALPSYLNSSGWGTGPWPIHNVPGQWMNDRTKAIFARWASPNGLLVQSRYSNANPAMQTADIANAALVDSMASWNQNQWGDPRFPQGAALQNTKYIYGDYDPATLPGIVNGVKTDKDTVDGAGIMKFTDLTENFSQSTNLSAIDGLPIGSLIWNDAQLAAYNSANAYAAVWEKYCADVGCWISVRQSSLGSSKFALVQNYPNPFNPMTTIRYALPQRSHVTLAVYNTLGQLVRTLVRGEEQAGDHEVKFDGSGLASGVYFYRLQAGGLVKTMKALILR